MPSWGNTDDAANSVNYATLQVHKTPNTVNQAALFNNTTVGAWTSGGQTVNNAVGQFGVTTGEMQAARAGAGTKMAHAGWHLRTVGTGGRAGRVQYECLVAMNTITGDADNSTVPNYLLSFSTQPQASNTGSKAGNATITLGPVVGASAPTGATLTYKWQYWNGSAFADITANTTYSTVATATLTTNCGAFAATGTTTVRAAVSATGAATVYSTNSSIIVTT